MQIEIYSDIVCPWCYMGKTRLERALESFDTEPVEVVFRAFQLDPSPVPEPIPTMTAMAAKFGGEERARQIFAQTTETARGDGLELNFDRAIAANTFDAHRLSWWAATHGRQVETMRVLHAAHFTDGVDVGSRAELARLAGVAGLDAAAALAFLESDGGTAEVRAEIRTARELGISSVPTFVIAGKYAVTGAQDSATLRSVLDEVVRREAVA